MNPFNFDWKYVGFKYVRDFVAIFGATAAWAGFQGGDAPDFALLGLAALASAGTAAYRVIREAGLLDLVLGWFAKNGGGAE